MLLHVGTVWHGKLNEVRSLEVTVQGQLAHHAQLSNWFKMLSRKSMGRC